MISLFTLGLAALPCLGAAYLTEPSTPAAPDTIADCSFWHIAADIDTCASISEWWGNTEAQFVTWNPSLEDGCELIVGNSYCVEQNSGLPLPTSTISSVTSTSQMPTATPTTALQVCEFEASGYKRYCARCLSSCASQTEYLAMCFRSVFGTINYYDSQCWQHGGRDCTNKAVDIVCPQN